MVLIIDVYELNDLIVGVLGIIVYQIIVACSGLHRIALDRDDNVVAGRIGSGYEA